jgi:oligopeptide/dipeptide ABC transporter ATP-binding protein
MTETVLAVHDLDVTIGSEPNAAHIVRGVDLEIRAGETVALVGESGCGKSTLVKALIGLADPDAKITGRARLDDVDLVSLTDEELRRQRGRKVGVVFQDPMSALNPAHRILRQVAEALIAHQDMSWAEAKIRAYELLAEVGLPDPSAQATRYPHELSGGMRQRVMIAIAIACDPPLLFADEPTTALDLTVQAQILALLTHLRARHAMAMLLVSHDLGLVRHFADRVCVMYAGQVVESGSAQAVFEAPSHPYTRGLMTATPVLDGPRRSRMPTIPGRAPDPHEVPHGCSFRPRCPFAIAACAEPIELTGDEHRQRCCRSDELPATPTWSAAS